EDADALATERRSAAAVDLWREQAVIETIGRLGDAGVDVLLLKGWSLAYTHYDAPELRPRSDVDLLVRPSSTSAVDRALTSAGWRRAVEPDAPLTSTQRHYRRSFESLEEQLDVHWKVSNARVFADAVSFDQLWSRSSRIARLGPRARGLA